MNNALETLYVITQSQTHTVYHGAARALGLWGDFGMRERVWGADAVAR